MYKRQNLDSMTIKQYQTTDAKEQEKIENAFSNSVLIFVAKHPVTKPSLKHIKKSECRLEEKIDELMKTAIDTTETIMVDAE